MRRRTALAFILGLSLCAPAFADEAPRAKAASATSQESADRAFQDFAREFMAKVRSQEERERHKPRVAAGPGAAVFTYRGYGEGFRTELRPTGQAVAPFVGLLHYTEHVYSCRDLEGGSCTVASTVPVTEIFRYQRGSWTY
jgi:hypothetical protein